MKFTAITLFPELFEPFLKFGPIRKAIEAGSLEFRALNLKFYAKTPKDTDDYPYGGGPGMVMRPEPLIRAITDATLDHGGFVILTDPRGKTLNQRLVHELSQKEHLVVVCGRYKDVDARVWHYVDMMLSLGDFVLSGGEIVAIALLDAVARLLPGALGDKDSAADDSFEAGLLGPPQFTRPRRYLGMEVPEILLSGDHKRIAQWRRQQALRYTLKLRPDLLRPKEDEDG